MWMQGKDFAPDQFDGAVVDFANRGVTVFHRERKFTRHERRAHALEFAARDPSAQHESLGASAERAEQRADPHLMRPRLLQRFLPDLRFPTGRVPERLGSLSSAVLRHYRRVLGLDY